MKTVNGGWDGNHGIGCIKKIKFLLWNRLFLFSLQFFFNREIVWIENWNDNKK